MSYVYKYDKNKPFCAYTNKVLQLFSTEVKLRGTQKQISPPNFGRVTMINLMRLQHFWPNFSFSKIMLVKKTFLVLEKIFWNMFILTNQNSVHNSKKSKQLSCPLVPRSFKIRIVENQQVQPNKFVFMSWNPETKFCAIETFYF